VERLHQKQLVHYTTKYIPLAGDVCDGEIENCGHYVMEEQPEEVARMLLGFFQKEECNTVARRDGFKPVS